jgi:hypothetical protein
MNLLKKLLGGGGASRSGDASGMYYYVRSDRTGEVIQVRLNRENDLSLGDDGASYYARKVIVGQKSFDRIEAEFYFDGARRFVSCDVTGGALVERDDYEQYLAEHKPKA